MLETIPAKELDQYVHDLRVLIVDLRIEEECGGRLSGVPREKYCGGQISGYLKRRVTEWLETQAVSQERCSKEGCGVQIGSDSKAGGH